MKHIIIIPGILALIIMYVGTLIGKQDCIDFHGVLKCSDHGIVSYNDQDCLLLNNVTNNYLILCPK